MSKRRPGPHVPMPAPKLWLAWLGRIGACLALLLAGAYLAPQVQVPNAVAYAVGFSAIAGGALFVSLGTPAAPAWSLTFLIVPAASLVAMGLVRSSGLETALSVTACLLIIGTLVGGVVGHAIEHPGHLLFVAVMSSVADVLSVFQPGGVSGDIVESEVFLLTLALPWPMLGTQAIVPMLGVGDVVFVSLYVAASRRHGLAVNRTLVALGAAFAVTVVAVLILASALPALPLLSAAILLAHPAARRPDVAELQQGIRGALVIALAVAAFFALRA